MISAYQFRRSGAEFILSLTSKKEGAGVNIAFVCTEKEEKMAFSGENDSRHHFVWRTLHACPVPTDEEFSAAENEGEGGEETAEGDLREGDLPVGGISRRWMSTALLLTGWVNTTLSTSGQRLTTFALVSC